jgi:uncharacterized protein
MPKDRYDFNIAAALMRQKEYARALAYGLPYANAGNADAQCLMGLLYEHGMGVSMDLDEAERWLRKAAQQDNAVAWNNLGTLLLSKGDHEQAKNCYQQAVELGFIMAAPLAK